MALEEIPSKKGLSIQDHQELNAPEKNSPERYAELRALYSQDPLALEQIDVYDSSSPYGHKMEEYSAALKSGDDAKAELIEAWFKEHYPYMGQ